MRPEPHIMDALFNNQKVIIKGLGIFYPKEHPATIHPGDHQFHPPGCTIHFEYEPLIKDEGFIHYMAERTKTTEKEVENIITRFSEQTIHDLKAGKKVLLQNMGALFYGQGGEVTFEADNSINVSKEFWGLPAFKAEMVRSEPREKAKTPLKKEQKSKEQKKPKREKAAEQKIRKENKLKELKKKSPPGRGKKRTILGLAIVLLLGVIVGSGWYYSNIWLSWIPDSEHKRNVTAFFSAEEEKKDTSPVQGQILPPVPSPTDTIVKEKPEDADKKTGHLSDSAPTSEKPPKASMDKRSDAAKQGDFLIIAGCFGSEENAKKKMKELLEKGYPASIQGTTAHGLHRVVYGFYTDRQEALSALNRIRKDDSQAWLDRY